MGHRQSNFLFVLVVPLIAAACSSSSDAGTDAATDDDTGAPDTTIGTDDTGGDSTIGDGGKDGTVTDSTTTDADTSADADVVVDTGSPFCSTPGAIESEPCGKCGTHSRLCAGDGGTWLPWGACTGEIGDCTPSETRETACGKCGKRTETCSPKCAWDKGVCGSEGVCNPGDVETAYACTSARQTKTRTCDSTCTWSAFTDCAAIKGWDDMAVAPIGGRQYHTAVWTGSDMVVWGGNGSTSYLADGAKYNLTTDTWTVLPAAPIVGRYGHVAVAAGTGKMIVWGGYNAGYRNDGAVLDLTGTTPTWTTMTAPPSTFYGRYYASAVWTGTEMFVYGGYGSSCSGSYCADGALYNPTTNTWRTPSTASPIAGREYPAMVWNGSKAVIFGGYGSGCTGSYCSDGGTFDPSTLTWATLKSPAPFASDGGRYYLSGVANGTQATFWGGYGTYVSPSYYKNTGGSYDDSAGTWKNFTPPTDSILPNSKRRELTAWWGGGKFYVWGGYSDAGSMGNGAIYDPATDTWVAMPTTNAPTARYEATVVWTGAEAIIWGGQSSKNDGKVYRP